MVGVRRFKQQLHTVFITPGTAWFLYLSLPVVRPSFPLGIRACLGSSLRSNRGNYVCCFILEHLTGVLPLYLHSRNASWLEVEIMLWKQTALQNKHSFCFAFFFKFIRIFAAWSLIYKNGHEVRKTCLLFIINECAEIVNSLVITITLTLWSLVYLKSLPGSVCVWICL